MASESGEVPAFTDEVILVDEHDQPLGVLPKLAAHERGGQLHRAFSVFVFNRAGQLLLQRRADAKYHFGGLWTNTCCSHPRLDCALIDFARARLRAEMGIDVALEEAFSFVYRATDARSGLTEHEYDHVLFGHFDGDPRPDPSEVGDWKWVDTSALRDDVAEHPDRYTPWFRLVLERVLEQRSA
jgi:isopentenyl-diphosphate Delta-isomerase